VFYLPYALCWCLGVTALFALTDPRIAAWRPDGGAVLAALTFAINLLVVRAIDDIGDLDYDRTHNPGRPLPSGAVRVSDLVTLIAAGAAVMLALNIGRGATAVLLAAQLGYGLLLVLVARRWHWPAEENILLGAWIGFPVQILLNLFLYAGLLHQAGLGPTWHAVLPLLIASTAFLHLEYGRKLTRHPRPGERTYVAAHGVTTTTVIAVVSAVASVALALVVLRPWGSGPGATPWGWLVLVPLGFLGYGCYRFLLARTARWPVLAAALFLLASFVSYLALGLIGQVA
jgi:4-hydroxybenzoate polyprenyltransferase